MNTEMIKAEIENLLEEIRKAKAGMVRLTWLKELENLVKGNREAALIYADMLGEGI